MSVFLCVGVSGLVSVCRVCQPFCLCHLVCLLGKVWVGKSLCISGPWGWRAEQLQVATGKSKLVRVGGCEVGGGWMKSSERARGRAAEGVQVDKRRKTRGTREVRVLLVSPPALPGPNCACSSEQHPQLAVNWPCIGDSGWRERGEEPRKPGQEWLEGWWRGSGSWSSIPDPFSETPEN